MNKQLRLDSVGKKKEQPFGRAVIPCVKLLEAKSCPKVCYIPTEPFQCFQQKYGAAELH